MNPLSPFIKSLLIGSLSFLSFTCAAWEEQPIEDGSPVTVWTQAVSDSDFKAFKGEVIINAPLDRVLKVIRDTKNVPKWYYNSMHAEQLQRISKDQSLNYSVTSAPWPVSDRDSVILATVTRHTNGNVTIKMKARPDDYPLQENLIRIPKLDGSWSLEKLDAQTTKVSLQVTTEPGGSIPSWLANAMVIDMPFYSLSNLKERVENKLK
ncbi:MAG: START domain-containing protein [Pseudomonadota bacterium]|nr:START domain-containing protein [Pseudomonadota bacterium]